jgi:hypothetical protein
VQWAIGNRQQANTGVKKESNDFKIRTNKAPHCGALFVYCQMLIAG